MLIAVQVARELKLDPVQLRAKNFYQEGDSTPFGQKLVNCNVTKCWEQLEAGAEYKRRMENIQKFNADNTHRKRGMHIDAQDTGKFSDRDAVCFRACLLAH